MWRVTSVPGMKSGLFLPVFDELSDPRVVAALAAEAEEAGWHGVFVWDHIAYRDPVRAIADPWVTLSAIATTVHEDALERPPGSIQDRQILVEQEGEGPEAVIDGAGVLDHVREHGYGRD